MSERQSASPDNKSSPPTIVAIVRTAALAILVLGALSTTAACGTDDGRPVAGDAETAAVDRSSGEAITIDGAEALQWGDGPYGVVLAHGAAFDAASWEAQATRIAERAMTVVAVEDISIEAIAAAVEHLRGDLGLDGVALVGASAGADAILSLVSQQPKLADQLILLSPNRVVDGLGSEPKLFVASEDETVVDVSRRLADSAPGDENEALIIPGSAHAQNIFDTDQGKPVTEALLEHLERFATE